jgi:hypothetical protein
MAGCGGVGHELICLRASSVAMGGGGGVKKKYKNIILA